MLRQKIAPSIMCAKLETLSETLKQLEESEVAFLHVDIMDGEFVPNLMLGTAYCQQLRKLSRLPIDFHFMVNNTETKMRWFPIADNDMVSFHIEAMRDLGEAWRILAYIRKKGAHPFLAINPDTPFSRIISFLDEVDGILIMTVNPGHAGQKLVPETLEKIRHIRGELDRLGYTAVEIEVDGNVSFAHARTMQEAGANIFVAGSSSVFSTGSLQDNISCLRRAIAVHTADSARLDTAE